MLMRQLDRDLHPFGLSTNDYEILVELSEAPGTRLRMTELADLTAQSRSRLSYQVDKQKIILIDNSIRFSKEDLYHQMTQVVQALKHNLLTLPV